MAPEKTTHDPYRAFFHNMGIAAFIAEENTIISFANAGMEELSGYSADELQGEKSWTEFVSEKDLIELLARRKKGGKKKAGQNDVEACEFIFTNKSGKKKHVLMSLKVLPETNQTVASVVDINGFRQTKMALEETETYNRALLEAIPDLIFIINKDGIFKDYNAPDKSKLLLPPEAFLNKHVSKVLSPDISGITLKNLKKLFDTGQPRTYEYQAIMGGVRRSFESRLVLCGDDKALSIIRDITDRKVAEDKLKESEDIFRALAENSPFAIMIYQDDYYVYVNRAGEEITGYSRDELYEMRFWEVVHPDHQTLVISKGQERQSGRNISHSYDVKLRKKDGTERWGTVSGVSTVYHGKPAGFISITDITDRKRAEDSLRKSEERYRGILATMEEGYYEVDLKGNLLFCNISIAKLVGYDDGDLVGLNFKSLCNESDEVFRKFNRVYKSGKPETSLTMELVRKDGVIIYGEFSVTPVRGEKGEIKGFRGVVRDITERQRYEEQLMYLSMHDQLTDLYNRAYFENEITRLEKSREYPITLISADLDGLKLVNDTMGHDHGDEVLVACARLLQDTLRSSDIITRVGGDEFAVILPRTGRKLGEEIVERIKKAISVYNSDANVKLPLSLSVGYATAEDNSNSLAEYFKEADNLMYRDKLNKGIDARSQIIRTLMVTLGERDFIAEGHARRLEEYCIRIGKMINLSNRQLSNLALLAQVHDIGKVGIPDHILYKKGSLTDDEWKTMRQHAEKGYRIALSSMDLSEIADLILKHHEKWMGDGYPMGISEEDIPLECRILAVVDAYDAMTNDRPYRKAMSKEEAVAELKICAGTHFDPQIIEVFLEILEENSSEK